MAILAIAKDCFLRTPSLGYSLVSLYVIKQPNFHVTNKQGIAENEFLDVVAHCTDAGEVVIYPSHFAVIESDEKKLRKQRKVHFKQSIVNELELNLSVNR